MSFALLRFSALGGALVLMAGCGGSPGGGSGGGGTGGGGSPTTVTFTISGGTPTAVATKVGSGSFTAATLSSGKLTLSLPTGTTSFAVAFACPPVTGASGTPGSPVSPISLAEERVFEASTLDGTSFAEACPGIAPASGATGTLTGSVDASAISGVGELFIYAQSAQQGTGFPPFFPVHDSTGNFSFAAPAGTDRVMVAAYSLVASGNLETTSLIAAKNFSSQAVPGALNGGNTVVLSAADQTTTEQLTYQSVPSGYTAPTTLVGYRMGNVGIAIAGAATSEYPAFPAGAVESGDFYTFSAVTSSTSNSTQATHVATSLASAGPESITFPLAWPYAGPTPAAQPSFDFSYTGFSGTTGVSDGVEMIWAPTSNAENVVLVTATRNYLNGSTTVAIPDFSGLTGFLAPPASGIKVTWSAQIFQGSSPALQPSASDEVITTMSNSGVYAVP